MRLLFGIAIGIAAVSFYPTIGPAVSGYFVSSGLRDIIVNLLMGV